MTQKELEFIADDIAAGFFYPGTPLYFKLSGAIARALMAYGRQDAKQACAHRAFEVIEQIIKTPRDAVLLCELFMADYCEQKEREPR
jgi:hypothetical protein